MAQAAQVGKSDVYLVLSINFLVNKVHEYLYECIIPLIALFKPLLVDPLTKFHITYPNFQSLSWRQSIHLGRFDQCLLLIVHLFVVNVIAVNYPLVFYLSVSRAQPFTDSILLLLGIFSIMP